MWKQLVLTLFSLSIPRFCTPCILSWAVADPRQLCPNCKTPFTALLLSSDEKAGDIASESSDASENTDTTSGGSGTATLLSKTVVAPAFVSENGIASASVSESANASASAIPDSLASNLLSISLATHQSFHLVEHLLSQTSIQATLAPIVPVDVALEAAITLAPDFRPPTAPPVAVPLFRNEETEDAAEARFWAAEALCDAYDYDGDDGVVQTRRVRLGNRRGGAGGFMAGGRMEARVGGGSAGASGSRAWTGSRAASGSASGKRGDEKVGAGASSGSGGGGRRKKKVKKNSREGRAAAAAAASEEIGGEAQVVPVDGRET